MLEIWAMKLGAEAHRALVLLSQSQDGCTDAVLMGPGFKLALITALVQSGLATARHESILVKGHQIEGIRLKIADDGRRSLHREL